MACDGFPDASQGHLSTAQEYLECTGPNYLGEPKSFYGNKHGTCAVVQGFKPPYNAGFFFFPSYTVGYQSTSLIEK